MWGFQMSPWGDDKNTSFRGLSKSQCAHLLLSTETSSAPRVLCVLTKLS